MINLLRETGDMQSTYAVTQDSGCESIYEMREGLLVIPILGSPTDAPVVVRVHSPYTVRKSAFSYTKNGAPPYIPSPGDTRSGYTFLGGHISIPAPGVFGNEVQYKVSGMYNFVGQSSIRETGKILWDAHPFISAIDAMSAYNTAPQRDNQYGGYYNSWNGQYFELDTFSSNRILG